MTYMAQRQETYWSTHVRPRIEANPEYRRLCAELERAVERVSELEAQRINLQTLLTQRYSYPSAED